MRRVILRRASEPWCCCSAPMGSHLFVFSLVPLKAATPTLPLRKWSKVCWGNHRSLCLSTPKSLISCGTTSESTTKPRYSHYQGNRGFKQRKMDLEGIRSKSAHTSRPLHSTPLHVHRRSLPPFPFSPSPTSFSDASPCTAVKGYKYLGAWATSNKINWREGLWQAITPFWEVWQRFIRCVTAAEALRQSTGTRRKIVSLAQRTRRNGTLVTHKRFRLLFKETCTTSFAENTPEIHVKVHITCVWCQRFFPYFA